MAHEITSRDGLVLTRNRAWHGLGTIVENAPTPAEALVLAGLNWPVTLHEMSVQVNGVTVPITTHRASMRGDQVLGVVGDNYQPVQNAELAEFAYAIGAGREVKVETAGSIQGGAKVWFLLQGEAFAPIGEDLMWPYLLLSNAHNGTAALRATATSVRAVCSNTLHQVIPRGQDDGDYRENSWSARHTGRIMDRVAEARASIQKFLASTATFKENCEELAQVQINHEQMRTYFDRVWEDLFFVPPTNPTDAKQVRELGKYQTAAASFVRRFDDGRPLAGATMWNAFNAFSGLIQHDMKARGSDDARRVENRVTSNLFGLNANRTCRAFAHAFGLAG